MDNVEDVEYGERTVGDGAARYYLGPRVNAPHRFVKAIDEPHNGKNLLFPPTQLMHIGKKDARAIIFEHTLTQIMQRAQIEDKDTRAVMFDRTLTHMKHMLTQMTAKAGIV